MAIATQDGMIKPSAQPRYIRAEPVAAMPAPGATTGVVGWMRASLFSSPVNIVLTLLTVLLILWIVPPLIEF
ncbi:MAG: ral L-amino acid transport system permease protein, partial [Hyphomicrobiales bacterium]